MKEILIALSPLAFFAIPLSFIALGDWAGYHWDDAMGGYDKRGYFETIRYRIKHGHKMPQADENH